MPAVDILNANSSDSEDICPICHESLESAQVYELPECKHKFHTHCIVTWFRHRPSSEEIYNRPDGKCPCCGNRGINNDTTRRRRNTIYDRRLGWYRRPSPVFNDKVRAIKKYCNENETSRFITNTLTKWDEAKKHMAQCEKEYAEFKKELSSGTHDYKMVTKKINNQQKAIFNARKKFRVYSKAIEEIHIVPIIIPTTVDMS
tara:strand:+ start:211 stop:816 length:606 start_codon:yes stop_codon:yes gene_type:complete